MSCQVTRETFHLYKIPPEHCAACAECRAEWELHLALRELRAPDLGEEFNQRVLECLELKGHFQPTPPSRLESLWHLLTRALPPLAVAACLLLFLWMGNLAANRPPSELRSLPPDDAQLWSNLPDAVPPRALPGPAPSRQRWRLVRGDKR